MHRLTMEDFNNVFLFGDENRNYMEISLTKNNNPGIDNYFNLNLTDSRGCSYCSNSEDLINCKHCESCEHCEGSENLINSIECERCKNSMYMKCCIDCEDCFKCRDCNLCRDCSYISSFDNVENFHAIKVLVYIFLNPGIIKREIPNLDRLLFSSIEKIEDYFISSDEVNTKLLGNTERGVLTSIFNFINRHSIYLKYDSENLYNLLTLFPECKIYFPRHMVNRMKSVKK